MARQRLPVSAGLPFEYVALGRPYSAQNRTSGFNSWRQHLDDIVSVQVASAAGGRGFIPSSEEPRVLIVWLSAQPDADDHPEWEWWK